jgi:hypothetical protein
MQRRLVLLLVIAAISFSGVANASLTTIGTATYGGTNYNLIFEGTLGSQGLVWLDYPKIYDTWQNQVNWAAGLSFAPTQVTLAPGYTTTINWSTGWRLPATVDGSYVWGSDGTTTAGFNITTSEMGHLYYVSLGNKGYVATDGTQPQPGWGFINKGPFSNLQAHDCWSGTEYSANPSFAWSFHFHNGLQGYGGKGAVDFYALAVRPGEVSAVPIPGALWLLGSGLVGLAGFRRRFRKS